MIFKKVAKGDCKERQNKARVGNIKTKNYTKSSTITLIMFKTNVLEVNLRPFQNNQVTLSYSRSFHSETQLLYTSASTTTPVSYSSCAVPLKQVNFGNELYKCRYRVADFHSVEKYSHYIAKKLPPH